jgi:hypothetical protein
MAADAQRTAGGDDGGEAVDPDEIADDDILQAHDRAGARDRAAFADASEAERPKLVGLEIAVVERVVHADIVDCALGLVQRAGAPGPRPPGLST